MLLFFFIDIFFSVWLSIVFIFFMIEVPLLPLSVDLQSLLAFCDASWHLHSFFYDMQYKPRMLVYAWLFLLYSSYEI